MKVSDILRIKGNTLYTITPDTTLQTAVEIMAQHDIGSLVVMEYGELVGMLTFRELLSKLAKQPLKFPQTTVRSTMDDQPMTCTLETTIDEVSRIMLNQHTRYLPVLDNRTLMGVISFYDVAKAILDTQDFENKMLKAYIRNWPSDEETT